MATLAANSTGNFTAAGTWSLLDSTSFLNSENSSHVLTTAYSGSRSSTFTPGAIIIDGLGVKLSVRTGTTGTISVELITAGLVAVPGTEVTINTADLPAAVTADLNGGWIFFKFAAPVTLIGATGYSIEAKTSSSSQVSLFRDATAGNLSRYLRTTTTQAPVAGDDLIITKDFTAAGASAAITVTMNNTATTDFGSNTTSLVTPSLAICTGGTLTFGTAASTNYYLKQSGNVILYSGGTLNVGTTGGGEIPRTSTAVIEIDCVANVDFGITARSLSTWVQQGLSRTSGKNIFKCLLNGDAAVNATTLNVDTDTGWLSGDTIAVGTTTRTNTQCESGTLNGAAGASSLTVNGFGGAGGGVANVHSGTSPTQGEVILLTRNVQIIGHSNSVQTFINIKHDAEVNFDWVEMKWLGSATVGKRGIDLDAVYTATHNVSFQYCSLRNFEVTSSFGVNVTGAPASFLTFEFINCVTYLIDNSHYQQASAGSAMLVTLDSSVFMRSVSGSMVVVMPGITATNLRLVGAGNTGLNIGAGTNDIGTSLHDISVHGCTSTGITIQSALNGTIDALTVWRCGGSGLIVTSNSNIVINSTISNVIAFGNTTQNVQFNSPGSYACIFKAWTLSGDTTFATTLGINWNGGIHAGLTFIDCDFGTVTGIKTAHTTGDMNTGNTTSIAVQAVFINTKFASTTELTAYTGLNVVSQFASQKHDQTAGAHKTFLTTGTYSHETTTTHTGAHSLKMTPTSASVKMKSPVFAPPVANGATLAVSVYVYKDASYNGAQPRLILRANSAVGIAADVVLATATSASNQAWELLTGTSASVTDDGALETYVDCDGTAGNVYVDSLSAV